MTCIKKRLRIAYENIAFYGNKTWINDCIHYTRMNQELYARECKIQESEWTELVVHRPRTVQDVIPNSKLALYRNCEYNQSRELSYRPTLSFDITFHYPCLHRHSAYNEPWMLPEVEELFMMHTCVDTFNFLCYKRLEDLPNLDFIDAQHSDDFCCQLDIEEDFHEISPMLEDMFDRTPGQPCVPPVADMVIPPLYKITTLDEMLMKMKLRFGNIRQIWSVSKGGTCPDRAMKVFKSPFKSSFVREKHQFDIRGIELFTIFPHSGDARRLRNLREIRSIQKLAEAIKDFKESLKQIKYHHQSALGTQQQHQNSSSQGTSAPSLAPSAESGQTTTTSSSAATTPATSRRLYSDVVQGLSNTINKTAAPSLKSNYYSIDCASSTPTNSSCISARESYISISSSASVSPLKPTAITAPTRPTAAGVVEECSTSSQHSMASSSYRTQTSSVLSTCSEASSTSVVNVNGGGLGANLLQRGGAVAGGRVVENSSLFPNVQQQSLGSGAFSSSKPQPQPFAPQHHNQQQQQQLSTYFYSNLYGGPCTNNQSSNVIGFYPSTSGAAAAAAAAFYHQNQNSNYYTPPPQQITFRTNQQQAVLPPQQTQVQPRTYQNQQSTSSAWLFAASQAQPQYTTTPQQQRNNPMYTISNLSPHPYLVVAPQGSVVKTARWPPQQPSSIQTQPTYSQRPSLTIAPPPQQQVYQPQTSSPAQTMWQHLNQSVYNSNSRATTSPPKSPQQPQSMPAPRVNSTTTILSRPSTSKTQPTSILVKPPASATPAVAASLDQQQQRRTVTGGVSCSARQPEDGLFVRGGGVVITSRSDDLERQALEEYQNPSNEMLLTEIERLAEEQYESSSENWPSPPSSGSSSRCCDDEGDIVDLVEMMVMMKMITTTRGALLGRLVTACILIA